MSFSDDINKFKTKVKGGAARVVKLTVAKLAESITLKTPVGDPSGWKPRPNGKIYYPKGYVGGTARANWQYGNGYIPQSFLQEQDKSGSRTIARIVSELNSLEPFTVHYITNNTPYIIALEDGHSKQAPAGMVKSTLLEFNEIVNSVSRLS